MKDTLDLMVPKMKESKIIDSAVFMMDIKSGDGNSTIYFGGRDDSKISSDSLITWTDNTGTSFWQVPITGFG